MENRLVRHHLAAPDVLSSEQLRKLSYILSFARLADFEPGAAGPGGTRGDVSVGVEIAPWRARVVDELFGSLREEGDPVTALTAARDVLAGLLDDQDEQRRMLAEHHRNDLSLAELDAEVGYKSSSLSLAVAAEPASSTSAPWSVCSRPARCPIT
jgi:hypothetical protein